LILEMLWKGHDITERLTKPRGVVIDLRRIRPPSGHKRRAAGIAQRELAIGAIKAHTPAGEPINIWRFNQRMPVTTQRIVHIIRRDEQHVQLGRCGFSLRGNIMRPANENNGPEKNEKNSTQEIVFHMRVYTTQ
jgi:hypothetical protein